MTTRGAEPATVHAYAVTTSVPGHLEYTTTVSATTRNRAIYDRWLDFSEAWPDTPFIRFKGWCRARKVLPPKGAYPAVERCYGVRVDVGDRIEAEGYVGTVIIPPSRSAVHVHFIADGMDHALMAHPSSVKAADALLAELERTR